MPREPAEKASDIEHEPFTTESILAELDRMRANLLAGKIPKDRESILGELGYTSYGSYLESPLWKKIRRRIFKRDGKLCKRCGGRATQVHHLNYLEPVLRGDDDAALVSICRVCHEIVERDGQGRWRPEVEKHKILHDENARRDREAREQFIVEEAAADRQYAGRKNYQCEWCGGNARSQGSIERVLRIRREENGRVLLCFGCHEMVTVDGRGRRRPFEEQRALLSRRTSRRYIRPEVIGIYGHANQPQNWKRLNVRQRESWEADRQYQAALLKEPKLATSDPQSYEILRKAYDAAIPHGRAKRPPRFRQVRSGPDPIPGFRFT